MESRDSECLILLSSLYYARERSGGFVRLDANKERGRRAPTFLSSVSLLPPPRPFKPPQMLNSRLLTILVASTGTKPTSLKRKLRRIQQCELDSTSTTPPSGIFPSPIPFHRPLSFGRRSRPDLLFSLNVFVFVFLLGKSWNPRLLTFATMLRTISF